MSGCNSQLYTGQIGFFYLSMSFIKFPAETTLSETPVEGRSQYDCYEF